MTGNASFERAHRFERALRSSITSETVPFTWGTAYFNPDFHKVWDLNFLAVETADPPFTGDELIAEADRLQGPAGLGHRRIAVDHPEWAVPLISTFKRAEWMVNRFLFMGLARPDYASIEPVRAEEIDRDGHRTAYTHITEQSSYGSDPEVVEQLANQTDLIAEHNDVRYFGAFDDGVLASVCLLFSDGETAQIEDVATLKDHRGRGLAKELLSLALTEAGRAGHDFVFLVADEEDWPKDLYGRLGFDPIGTSFDFVRPGDVIFSNEEA